MEVSSVRAIGNIWELKSRDDEFKSSGLDDVTTTLQWSPIVPDLVLGLIVRLTLILDGLPKTGNIRAIRPQMTFSYSAHLCDHNGTTFAQIRAVRKFGLATKSQTLEKSLGKSIWRAMWIKVVPAGSTHCSDYLATLQSSWPPSNQP